MQKGSEGIHEFVHRLRYSYALCCTFDKIQYLKEACVATLHVIMKIGYIYMERKINVKYNQNDNLPACGYYVQMKIALLFSHAKTITIFFKKKTQKFC